MNEMKLLEFIFLRAWSIFFFFAEEPRPTLNCPRLNGYFAHKGVCDKFYYCVDGMFNMIVCPAGLVFNQRTGMQTIFSAYNSEVHYSWLHASIDRYLYMARRSTEEGLFIRRWVNAKRLDFFFIPKKNIQFVKDFSQKIWKNMFRYNEI